MMSGKARTEIACSISWFRNWNECEKVEFGRVLLEKEKSSGSGFDADQTLDNLMNTMNHLSLNSGNVYDKCLLKYV